VALRQPVKAADVDQQTLVKAAHTLLRVSGLRRGAGEKQVAGLPAFRQVQRRGAFRPARGRG